MGGGGFLDAPLLRLVPGDSVVHRLAARTKLRVVLVVTLAVAWSPSWWAVAGGGALAVAGVTAARVPRGVRPPIPRLLVIGLAVSFVLAVLGGGVLVWCRGVGLALAIVTLAALVTWTTPPDALGGAVAGLLRPVRRVPVLGDAAAALPLALRSVPLLLDEARLLAVAWRTRRPEPPKGAKAVLRDGVDLLVTAVVVSTRRARDLGEAMAARGGPPGAPPPARLRPADHVALAIGVAVAAAIVLAG